MNDLFLRACRGEAVERTPVWMMRQAGRYMEEYRAIRAVHDFWTVCRTPELACEVTMQPIDALGVDAAILFSDILVGLPAMGVDVEFSPGPKMAHPVRSREDVAALKVPDPVSEIGYVLDAVRAIRTALDGRVPLIGFGGAPLTLAAYLIEGGGSKNFEHLKGMLRGDRTAARELLDKLVATQIAFLTAQVEAGAQAIQIFDTWGGILTRALFEEFALEPVQRIIEGLKPTGVPLIYFVKDAAHVLDLLASSGADVLSLDDKLPLDMAAEKIGPGPALQGNLDPIVLLGSREGVAREVEIVLGQVPKDRGHIFNLGHGILPPTPVDNALCVVETVRRLTER